jgi:hypothetical protein
MNATLQLIKAGPQFGPASPADARLLGHLFNYSLGQPCGGFHENAMDAVAEIATAHGWEIKVTEGAES